MSILAAEFNLKQGAKLSLMQGDLTEEKVDAIVNAANSQLNHGGGVAGAIVRRGGSSIQVESTNWVKEHGPVQNGQAAVTGAGNLDCKYVIHVVGPIWGEGDEEHKLSLAVHTALQAAEKLELTSIAFPAISTGIYGYPMAQAANVILEAIAHYFDSTSHSPLKDVRIILFDQEGVTVFHESSHSQWGNP